MENQYDTYLNPLYLPPPAPPSLPAPPGVPSAYDAKEVDGRLNFRFATRLDGAVPLQAGVVLHQFDGYAVLSVLGASPSLSLLVLSSAFHGPSCALPLIRRYQNPDAPWAPCDDRTDNAKCNDYRTHNLRHKISTSMIVGEMRSSFGEIPMFSYDSGVVLDPLYVQVLCAYGGDGSTDDNKPQCPLGQGQCVPGCGDPPQWCRIRRERHARALSPSCAEVDARQAGQWSCGQRVHWVIENLKESEAEARKRVEGEFPIQCVQCGGRQARGQGGYSEWQTCGFEGAKGANIRPFHPNDLNVLLMQHADFGWNYHGMGNYEGYNEVVVASQSLLRNLPRSIEAFFIVDCQKNQPNLDYGGGGGLARNCHDAQKYGRKAHRKFLAAYGVDERDFPLLLLRPRQWEAPFVRAPPEDMREPTCQLTHGQCGGQQWSGPTKCCEEGATCVETNEWHSACRPPGAGSAAGGG
jgi:hypothetical protein